ncbi:MAG: hypothetical protein A3C35_07100 [Omnitrophica bacterium RIFCSPHIGHO2_02_FULL_46_11]|nr:MAG: hypothetical protein A3C35_07100 [Omnitrophica bacterium RIFCSPHIGHO2_02_FULL_46_11]
MKICPVTHGILNGLIKILRSMLLEPDDAGTENSNPVRLQGVHQVVGIDVMQFGVLAVFAFKSHPHPRNAEPHQLFDAIRLYHAR